MKIDVIAKQRIMPISYLRWSSREGDKQEEYFIQAMKDFVSDSVNVVPIGRARSGIYLLTRFAVQRGRRRVLLSPYTIPDVAIMVALAGGEPVFYDFMPNSTACNLSAIEALIDHNTACVFVTHYHVNEPNVKRLRELCDQFGVLLFDDCALVLGGSLDGSPIGAHTDGSVFSFSSFKSLNYFWGGAITTPVPEIAEFLRVEVSSWPRLNASDYIKQASNCLKYDIASRPPFFNFVTFQYMRRQAMRTSNARGLQNVRVESDVLNVSLTSRPSQAACAEWNSKIHKISAVVAQRRIIATIYRQILGDKMISSEVPIEVTDGSCFVNFPVAVNPKIRQAVFRKMAEAGFDIGHNLYPNIHRHSRFSDCEGLSKNVQLLTEGSVYLPTHFGVSQDYAERVASKLATLV